MKMGIVQTNYAAKQWIKCDGDHCFSIAEVGLQELSDLLKQLAPQWKTLSLYLGIDPWITDGIDDKLTSEDCLSKVLTKWITNSDKDEEPTLEVLCKALDNHFVANQAVALKILKDAEVLELLTVSEKETGSAHTS